MHALFGGYGIEQLHHTRCQITHKHTYDEQHRAAFHYRRKHNQHQHHRACANECAYQRGNVAAYRHIAHHLADSAAHGKHHHRHTKSGTGAHAQNRRASQRIVEGGLEQKSRNSKRSTGKRSGENHGNASLKHDDVPSLVVALVAHHDAQHRRRINIDGAKHKASHHQQHQQRQQQYHRERKPA